MLVVWPDQKFQMLKNIAVKQTVNHYNKKMLLANL